MAWSGPQAPLEISLEKEGFVPDRSGNLLLTVGTGAHVGAAIVLRVEGVEVNDFGSLDGIEGGRARFFGDLPPEIKDVDGDGIHEILVERSDYDPSFAGGTLTRTTYRWSGTDYAAVACLQHGRKGTRSYPPKEGRC